MERFGPWTCPACCGSECRGGGFKDCVQRDPHPSVLTGILDHYGGLRFVVCHRDQIKAHYRPTEIPITVPKLKVHEPIAWGDIPMVTARIELEVDRWIERGIPNEPYAQQAVKLYRLRQLEQNRHSLDLYSLVET